MIEYITINQTPKNGAIQYNLSKNYGYIGLVQICLYGIKFQPKFYTVVNMVVEELDKTSDNPNRLITTLLFNQEAKYFYEKEFGCIQWKKFDSTGKQLNIKFYNEYGKPFVFTPRKISEEKNTYDQIQITLALLPQNTKWIEKL